MATKLLPLDEVDLGVSQRSLILVWQNPTNRRFMKVGQLDALPGKRYAFHYFPEIAKVEDFVPLDEFPSLTHAYVSDEVPAFFANRILSAERRGYNKYLTWLGIENLDASSVPFEFLARSGGGRATDTFHVLDLPVLESQTFASRFFISGIRYMPDADRILSEIHDGSVLTLELDEANAANPKAVLIDTLDGSKIGYVPDWLCHDIHGLVKDGWSLTAVAERVNPEAPAHVRVLCRVDAVRAAAE
ncbi:HIRAN domain-containing protein [Microbacterium sp. 22215]|uniref:HIRAN domain-containing protein n=1 Tax=Microbacterium sp. 22215 TaxID=3453893 RepID=UPI003F82FDE6